MGIDIRQREYQLHIGIFGKRNSGKSTLINALTGEYDAAAAGAMAGSTNPAYKSVEVEGIGPCVLIDTAGFDDTMEGVNIEEATKLVLEDTDIALIVCSDENIARELDWAKEFKDRNTPVIMVINKIDQIRNTDKMRSRIYDTLREEPIKISAISKVGIEKVREEIIRSIPSDFYLQSALGELVQEGDKIMFVMSKEKLAPAGRLTLPEQQIMRELLDMNCVIISNTVDRMTEALEGLTQPPRLIITEGQLRQQVKQKKPADCRLVSFSELF